MTSLLLQLQALEIELHHPGARCSHERLEQLLNPEFQEVGRSGRAYTREIVVNYLSAAEPHPSVASEGFALAELGPEVALLTYRSAHIEPDGSLVNHTLRSSVWVNTSTGWQLRYHQGTPACETW